MAAFIYLVHAYASFSRKLESNHEESRDSSSDSGVEKPEGRKRDSEARSRKVALITGITGQDGSYLAELLLEKGYEVHGIVRRVSTFNRQRIEHLFIDPHIHKYDITLHYGDLTDSTSIRHIINKVKPDEIYHLGAQSHVRISFDLAEFTGNTTGLGTLRLLEAIRDAEYPIKFYQASSSEMFGKVQEIPQTEKTPFYPRSPYACAKVYAYWLTVNYRESYGIFACNGILFNHESERRGENFVTRKITIGLAGIKAGKLEKLYLGNLDAKRDWGHAKDYVEGMWRMLQQEKPDDYLLATGETHSVREFVEEAAKHAGMDIEWQGSGLEEKGIDRNTGKTIIEIDPRYFRPAEVDLLIGDPKKSREKMGWEPKIKFKDLAGSMMEHDLKNINKIFP
ncbi:MAG: GDP-mannose 4,6-dehydratase [Candidatus Moranbacteria bacterium]|nr:GDP-mannose 4,6-dehydratase [Candidatus Moranbacteria bacterium]